jgi:hypothetical protein
MQLTEDDLRLLTDDQLLVYACKGDEMAVKLCKDMHDIAAVWDDIVDRDPKLQTADVHRVFTKALIDIPGNPFFQAYLAQLLPIFRVAILNWHFANHFEAHGTRKDVEMGHTLRYAPGDIITTIISIIGGMEWAIAIGPELRRRVQRDDLHAYLKEHGHD